MHAEAHQKIMASHLQRSAYLYIRQSTPRQVLENTESTVRQYALRDRAVALGWPLERVVVIDHDQGHSGETTAGRVGFQKLVADVSMGQVGLVLGLEVSRLARSSTDWMRLLEICALTDTLLLDEDGVYDPSQFNDRLLLGLKGTLSEVELHVLRARMVGGLMNKARRGELRSALPVGLVYGPDDRVALDPDQHVQDTVRLFFQTFRRTGSASATVRAFRTGGLHFPRRIRSGPHKDEICWGPLEHSQALRALHNPRYAGAFVFGRRRYRKTVDGKYHVVFVPRDQWIACFVDAHPGYIPWAEYEDNLRKLRANAQAMGGDRRLSPPREGSALLQGLVVCGRCGERMTVHYHSEQGQPVPQYVCQHDGIERGTPICQRILGRDLDRALGELLIVAVTPLSLEVALTVQQELIARAEEVERLRQQEIEHARYEADLAQRRYMRVDPDRRLVADALEADWNEKLRALAALQEKVAKRRDTQGHPLDDQQRAEILALATDFPRLWRDPRTPHRERKRLAHLMLEDVTLLKRDGQITAHVRFKGGAVHTLTVPLQGRKTDPETVRLIDRLLNDHTIAEVVAMLNAKGVRSYEGKPFTKQTLVNLRLTHKLPSRYTRLRAAGLLTDEEIAAKLGISVRTLPDWRRKGLVRFHACNTGGPYLYEPPGDDPPVKGKWVRTRERATTRAPQ